MRLPVAIFMLLLLCQGCQTHSQCRRELYQSYYGSAVDAVTTMKAADKLMDKPGYKGTPDALRAHGIMSLEESLTELHKLNKAADKQELERMSVLARVIMKYSESHREELARCDWSLRMLAAFKSMLRDPDYARRVEVLEDYVRDARKDLPLLER
jgi:hypothetical protein